MKTFFQRPDKIRTPLQVVTTVFNSARFRSRWKLMQDFMHMCENVGAELTIAEVAFGKREFALNPDNAEHAAMAVRYLQLRTSHELWLKENAINLAVQRLPADWEYVAWVDGDVTFARPDWADETVHALQHYPVVQMWTEAQDMNARHEVIHHWRSLAWNWREGRRIAVDADYPYYGKIGFPHPGFAWAMRRDAWDKLGGLMDHAILGSGDMLMGLALVGKVERGLSTKYHPRYKELAREWQGRATRHIKGNLGAVDGLVLHHWHGPKADRRYRSRWQILVENGFNPDTDVKRDWQGLMQLTDRKPLLRDQVRKYFHERNEDAL